MKKRTYETGLAGESKAAEWLKKNRSMKMLETRYRNIAGEIDLIMLDGDTVVFIEVKTRLRAEAGRGLLAVDSRKQRRIANSAVLYLKGKGWLNRAIRFDVAEVTQQGVLHIPNAFQPGGLFYH